MPGIPPRLGILDPDAARHTGYAPTDKGDPVLGHLTQHAVGHSGYAPADTAGRVIGESHAGTPGGMTASGGHAQGSGDVQDGPHHTGWAPEDREYKEWPADGH